GELGQYPKLMRHAVREQWALHQSASLFVAAVAPDGAAARAGVVPGLAISSIAGRHPMRMQNGMPTRLALINSEEVIASALAAGPLEFETVARDGTRRQWSVAGRTSCPTRFEMSAEDEPQAYADGEVVQVTAGMAAFTNDNEDELAAVAAHELGHNILRHLQREEAAGTPNNYTRYLGRYSRISRKMEEEADRLSVWLLVNAGYQPTAPVQFWQRFGPGHDSPHPFGRLHEPWRNRVAAIEDELRLMRAERARNASARPALLDQANVVPVVPAP
ncbi:MAG: M48 family metallopeptidase, partial [Sphingopyxis sp.]